MHRAIPVGNRILNKKWQDKQDEIHTKKLREVKSSLDLKQPSHFNHLRSKAKKE